jgi:anti-sigma factor RsiW
MSRSPEHPSVPAPDANPGRTATPAQPGGLLGADESECISAFIDGGLNEPERSRIAERLSRSEAHQSLASRYWLISDVLNASGASDHRPALSAKIAQRIAQEPVFMPQPGSSGRASHSGRSLSPGLKLAASFAGLVFVGAGAFFVLSLPTESDPATLLAGVAKSVGPHSAKGMDPRVMRASFDSPEARAFLDAHGASHVRLRMDDR